MAEINNQEKSSQIELINESSLTQEKQDFIVTKLGLKLEDLSSAQTNPSFSSDLQNLMNNPENTTERTAFLGKYIYDQIIAEAQQKEKDPMEVAKMKKDNGEWNMKHFLEFVKYNRGLNEQAAINRNEKITKKENDIGGLKTEVGEGDTSLAINRPKPLENEKDLAARVKKATGLLKPEGQALVEQGAADLKKDPSFIKELKGKGFTQSEIQSGEFDQTIKGYYIARNQATLIPLATDQKKFQESSKHIADKLDLPREFPLIEIERTIPPGDRRNTVLANSADLLNSGKYDPELTTYNAGTGYITFHNKNTDDISRIDTSREPIKIEYMKNGLSISRELEGVSDKEAEKEKSRDKAVGEVREGRQKLEKGITDFRSLRTNEYGLEGDTTDKNGKPLNLFGIYVEENYEKHEKYTGLEQSYMEDIGDIPRHNEDKINTLVEMISLCKSMKDNSLGKMTDETLSIKNRGKINTMLETRMEKLEEFKRQEESLKRIDTEALNHKPKRMSSAEWENDAKESIGYFSSLGLDKLGQQGFTEFIAAWNYQNTSQAEFQIDLSKNPKVGPSERNALRSAIDMKIMKNGQNYNETFQNLEKKLNSNTWIQRNWNTREKRADFLFSGKINGSNRSKEDKNQQKQVDSIDNGSDQNKESQYA